MQCSRGHRVQLLPHQIRPGQRRGRTILERSAGRQHARDDFIGFCEGLALQLSGALARFRDDWLTEVAALDAKGLASARKREEACFAHIRRGLVVALERDPNVAHDRLLGALAPEPLCAFVWDSMLSSIKRSDPRCETLFTLLRRTLYEPPFA